MKISKRIIAAVLTGCMAAGSAQAVTAVTSFAASTKYSSDDSVWLYNEKLFYGSGETEPNAGFIKALKNATGVSDYTDITFGDLEKITSLNLSGIGLEYVPQIIEYMPRLKTLNLSKNNLRSASLNSIDLTECPMLTSLDLSYNYLTTVPSWYTSLNISKKDISYNLINTSNQRKLTMSPTVYYFDLGDSMSDSELNKFKDEILATVTLSDGSSLPEYYYNSKLHTYDIPDSEKNNLNYTKNENIEVDLDDIDSYIKNGVVNKAGSITGTVSLFVPGSSTNPNISCEFTVYFLDPNDVSTAKVRLEVLIAECEKYTEDTYTGPSWTVFSNQLKTAKTILAYNYNDNEMLQSAYESLSEAKGQLVAGVNSTTEKTLTDLLAIAKTYSESDYTADSWKAMSTAIALLQSASSDSTTSLEDANKAIKAFQDAQNGLVPTKKITPATITKSQFEGIYGTTKTLSASGATRDGAKYTWSFIGTDVSSPADFNPEVSFDSDNEEAIRFEVGSVTDYKIISFAQAKTFPGIGQLTIDVSDTYTNGIYKLYKWNTTTKKSEYVKEVTVKDGYVTTSFDEGGDYFISSVVQNFEIISSNFVINNDKRTISAGFKKKYTVADFRSNLENGSAVKITNADGTAVSESQYISTGMKASAPNSDASYTVIVLGDVDGDGNVTALDAVSILKAVIGEITLDSYEVKAAADVSGDGWVRADDAVYILKYIVGIE